MAISVEPKTPLNWLNSVDCLFLPITSIKHKFSFVLFFSQLISVIQLCVFLMRKQVFCFIFNFFCPSFHGFSVTSLYVAGHTFLNELLLVTFIHFFRLLNLNHFNERDRRKENFTSALWTLTSLCVAFDTLSSQKQTLKWAKSSSREYFLSSQSEANPKSEFKVVLWHFKLVINAKHLVVVAAPWQIAPIMKTVINSLSTSARSCIRHEEHHLSIVSEAFPTSRDLDIVVAPTPWIQCCSLLSHGKKSIDIFRFELWKCRRQKIMAS